MCAVTLDLLLVIPVPLLMASTQASQGLSLGCDRLGWVTFLPLNHSQVTPWGNNGP